MGAEIIPKDKKEVYKVTDMVFINDGIRSQEPFTTSDIIAEHTKHSYRSIQRTIENHLEQLKRFGRVRFEFTPFETKGGIQNKKIYKLNEPQATLLITFLRNTDIVTEFKTELVRQFYLMRSELMKRQQARTELKPIRRELTDAIRDRSDLNQWAYKSFTDLAYLCAIGKTAAQIKKERGAHPKAPAVSFLSAEELETLSVISNRIAVLIDLGMDYKEIKKRLCRAHTSKA